MDALQSYIQWVDTQGFHLHPQVELRLVPGRGIGLVTLTLLPPKTRLFRVPPSSILSPRTSQARSLLSKSNLSPWNRLIVALVKEVSLGLESHWHPYLATLPTWESGASSPGGVDPPILWPKHLRDSLKGTGCESVDADELAIKSSYDNEIVPFLTSTSIDPKWWTYSIYVRLGLWVGAYSFTFDDGPCMVPVADALNHRSGHNNARLFTKGGVLCMSTLDKPVDGELFNTYGSLSSAQLLRRYGFVDAEENPAEACHPPFIRIWEALSKDAMLMGAAARVLEALGLIPEDERSEMKRRKTLFDVASLRERMSDITLPIEASEAKKRVPVVLRLLARLGGADSEQLGKALRLVKQHRTEKLAIRAVLISIDQGADENDRLVAMLDGELSRYGTIRDQVDEVQGREQAARLVKRREMCIWEQVRKKIE